jgi:hypothetical protein
MWPSRKTFSEHPSAIDVAVPKHLFATDVAIPKQASAIDMAVQKYLF